ncbi:MAG: hypothetical protein EA383_05765 [Spirochaetaceae bacterium]|nr:MAG: hypothetical protein EA383_05765 [Spirochaetaceae bacterium]
MSSSLGTNEQALYRPVKTLFESLGFTVMGEVGAGDVLAVFGERIVTVELKLRYSVRLFEQAVERQKTSDLVYVGLPSDALSASKSRRNAQEKLMRRLGLGLVLIYEGELARFTFHPQSIIPRVNRKKRDALVGEIRSRIMDANVGGSTRTALLTAYRQEAMYLAVVLRHEKSASPKRIRALGGSNRCTRILRDNHYGWFSHLSRGLYGLSDRGYTEPDRLFPEVMQVLKRRFDELRDSDDRQAE